MIVEFPNPDSLAECLIADELSRLRDEVKALRAERDALLQQIVADYPPIEAELEEVSDRAFKAEAERDALRAALELYRGQVDQTGRHSAADAIKRAAQALGARETPRAAAVLQKPLD